MTGDDSDRGKQLAGADGAEVGMVVVMVMVGKYCASKLIRSSSEIKPAPQTVVRPTRETFIKSAADVSSTHTVNLSPFHPK